MAYRSDVEALAARHAALESELADKTRERDEAARMLVEARARERDEIAAATPPPRKHRAAIVFAISIVTLVAMAFGLAWLAVRPTRADAQVKRVVSQFEAFADETCACKSTQCIDDVAQRMSKWASDLEPPSGQRSEHFEKQLNAIGQRMIDCRNAMARYEAREVP